MHSLESKYQNVAKYLITEIKEKKNLNTNPREENQIIIGSQIKT